MLSERQGQILKAIIKEYTDRAVPVSSGLLKRQFGLNYSSATIRNEMMFLQKEGFLGKPHISAGRVPTDKGYRYFIDHLMGKRDVSESYVKKLEIELLKQKAKNARMERTTAKLLSSMSKCLAISGIVDKKEFFDFGVHNLLDDPEMEDLDKLSKMTAVLDLIDENVDKILEKMQGEGTEIFIGKENPIKEIQNFSMVVSPYKLKDGQKGLVALIGPKRMKYKENRGMIEAIKRLLGKKNIGLLLIIGSSILYQVYGV